MNKNRKIEYPIKRIADNDYQSIRLEAARQDTSINDVMNQIVIWYLRKVKKETPPEGIGTGSRRHTLRGDLQKEYEALRKEAQKQGVSINVCLQQAIGWYARELNRGPDIRKLEILAASLEDSCRKTANSGVKKVETAKGLRKTAEEIEQFVVEIQKNQEGLDILKARFNDLEVIKAAKSEGHGNKNKRFATVINKEVDTEIELMVLGLLMATRLQGLAAEILYDCFI